jgi:CMP-N-acetylneuraminic acid synthetase
VASAMILAVVPARGGSKRLPRKNVLSFGGRPLLLWSIALADRLRDVQTVVTTEDREVAAIAITAGATVIERPTDLAGDETAMIDVVLHAADTMRKRGLSFEGIMLLQPTNPLRTVDMVHGAMDRFLSEPCDSLVTVSGRALKIGTIADGVFSPNYSPHAQSRTTAPTYYENGLLYLTKTGTLFDKRSFYGDRILALISERPFDEVDIDEAEDLVVGEAILGAVRNRIDY